MINRVLIRVKVVQMLYSFWLSQSEFRIQSAPGADASRDNRFAYGVYSRLLWLIPALSGLSTGANTIKSSAPVKSLQDSMIAKSLAVNTAIRAIAADRNEQLRALAPLMGKLQAIITGSGAYRSYTHTRERGLADDVRLWSVMLGVISEDADFVETLRADGDFTLLGLRKGTEMAVETLRGYADTRAIIDRATRDLQKSLDQAYLLYNALLRLPVDLVDLQNRRLEAARNKYLPSDADLNPNLRFIDNKFVKAIEKSEPLDSYFKENPFDWDSDPTFLKSLLDKITASQAYLDYMEKEGEPSFEEDAELWRTLFRSIILPGDDLAEMLESKSVYWNDDLDIIGTFVVKTIKRSAVRGEFDSNILPQYKDEEDAQFGARLFASAIRHRDEYRALIDKFISEHNSWDPERLALMDIVVMIAAITEIVDYPAIPIPVTLNEYIEIANSYSTPNSGKFINGILYSVIKYLKENNVIFKD